MVAPSKGWPQRLDKWFDGVAEKQYTCDLLFPSMFDIMSQVVCGVQVSVNAAFQSIIKELDGMLPTLLPGYRVKILDGNCIEASDKRIEELRPLKSGALPGKSLVVLDPALRTVIDVFPCEDGHAQERSPYPLYL